MQPAGNNASYHGKNRYKGHKQLARLDELPETLVPFRLVRATQIEQQVENRKAVKTYKPAECLLAGGYNICVVCARTIPKGDAATVARVPEYRVTIFPCRRMR
jgi:hypothetical protein